MSKSNNAVLEVKTDGAGRIWSYIRGKWLIETPEERVRQHFLTILVNEYGFRLEQMTEEESVTGRGAGQARADFIIWRTIQDKRDRKTPLIVVECKSDNVTIKAEDYYQGDHYARMVFAPFFVTHNTRETRFWRVLRDRMPGYLQEIENIPHAAASDREIEELITRLKIFKENEFADLLHECHNVIRNREHLDPAAAFDEIAKVLFIKTWVERELRQRRRRQNLFTAEYLREQLGDEPLQDMFDKTKRAYQEDRIFDDRERLSLKPATGLEIVRLLERYNLSDTSEDVKGIAFERFLGRTFRGEIGQFFTPRPIVEFMVRMVDPLERDVVCDPASGSGGFLIRFFEIVREQILADVDRQYQVYVEAIEAQEIGEDERAKLLREKFEELQTTIDQQRQGSRLWKLANRCIYGCDANERMARTSKMNMIMHGDGHGGVHHHNGFINVNGIFEGRFDIILTNPPFGANVEPSDHITEGDVRTTQEQYRRYVEMYGQAYREAQDRVQRAADNKVPIASLFELPARGEKLGKIKTEILFIERCLSLLKPGGRLGIVLPEGIFNNPSLAYVREFCEDRAFIRAVVSLPQETFYSAGATVKASLLFMQKYTETEAADYEAKRQATIEEIDRKYQAEMDTETSRLQQIIDEAKAEIAMAKPPTKAQQKRMTETEINKAVERAAEIASRVPQLKQRRSKAQRELREYLKAMAEQKAQEVRRLLKRRFAYPVFLYNAEHVGITATGAPDHCELYADETLGLPSGTNPEDTALALYHSFQADPQAFLRAMARGGTT